MVGISDGIYAARDKGQMTKEFEAVALHSRENSTRLGYHNIGFARTGKVSF